jgi:hypothetical protein
MRLCNQCQHENAEAADVCARCGRRLLALPPTLPPLLPDPMVEPIRTPSKPPPDDEPLPACPVLTLGAKSSVVTTQEFLTQDGSLGLAPLTIRELPPSPPTQEHPNLNGICPADFGLPGFPMNDPVLQSPPLIAPATDGAPPPATPVARPRLVVLRGLRIGAEYPIYEGRNTIGRFGEKPVDIDLLNQESVEQIWCSRQHAVIVFEKGVLAIEDLNSLNGTWLNGVRVPPGQPRQLKAGDLVQIGTVQLRLEMI